ncbi:hypothetical protein [Brassicibacter mesophilus]|uniref:hypothetical protein n=1 Tax=Brassicibacter mesophilus TaxID=745119 RepID=UPI003D22A44D
MIIAKLGKDSIKRSEIPENRCVFKVDGKEYYIGGGKYDYDYAPHQLKPNLEYLVAIEVELKEDIIHITEDFYFLAFDEEYNLVHKVKDHDIAIDVPYIPLFREIILWKLLV